MSAAVEPITGRYMRLDIHGRPHRLYWEEAGSGIPLLCLHTAGADGRQYRALLNDAAITERFRVVVFDMPWHGKSSPPEGWEREEYKLTTDAYVEQIVTVAGALGLDRPVAIGCSIGGRVVLEPSDAQEALDFTKLAFELSERFDCPIIVRSTTRLSHTRSLVKVGERQEVGSRGFNEDPDRNVMIPSNARVSHPRLLERERAFGDFLSESDLVRWEEGDTEVGIISLSTAYTFVKEVMPDASVLKLGCSYPLPEQTIRDFAASVDRLIVVEELEPIIENEIRAMGIEVEGKAFFPRVGELAPEVVRDGFVAAGLLEAEEGSSDYAVTAPPRPPVLCAGCPHAGGYTSLRALNARVMGDIGCYTLAAVHPLRSIDTCVSMGSSIANAIGVARAGGETRPIVATIGDSTMLHAGIPPLIDAVYNDVDITVVLLDNRITAMTGGQNHAATGKSLRGEPTHRIDFQELIRAIGVKWVKKVDSYDLASMLRLLREATEFKGVAVVIADRPCVLDPVKIRGEPMQVNQDTCVACQACMNLGCPALVWSDGWHDGHHKVQIDAERCIGCSLCAQICPTQSIVAIAQ